MNSNKFEISTNRILDVVKSRGEVVVGSRR